MQPAWIRLLLSPELTSGKQRVLGYYKTDLKIGGRKFSLIGAFLKNGFIAISNKVYPQKRSVFIPRSNLWIASLGHEIKRNTQNNWFIKSEVSQKLSEFQAENPETETNFKYRLSNVLNFRKPDKINKFYLNNLT